MNVDLQLNTTFAPTDRMRPAYDMEKQQAMPVRLD